jgi:glycogen phosphorylase
MAAGEISRRAAGANNLTVERRNVLLRAWRYHVTRLSGSKVPVIFLDATLPTNSDQDRSLTNFFYGGDSR